MADLPGFADLRLTRTMWDVLNETRRTGHYLTSPSTGTAAKALERRGLIEPQSIYWRLTNAGRLVVECYGGERHSPDSRVSYGDGKRRTVCTRCRKVLIGPAVPWPSASALDAIDGTP